MAALRIKPHYSVVGHDLDTVELRCGVWNPVTHTVADETHSGHLFGIISSLDGSCDADQIASKVGVSRIDVERVIDHLRDIDVLEGTGVRSSLDYFLEYGSALAPDRAANTPAFRSTILLGTEALTLLCQSQLSLALPAAEHSRLPETDNMWRGLRTPPIDVWSDSLSFAQYALPYGAWADSFVIYLSATPNPTTLKALNRLSVQHGFPWLHACIDGAFVFVGPLILPRRTACYECFETRTMMNMRSKDQYVRYKNALLNDRVLAGAVPMDLPLGHLLTAHASLEVINYYLTHSAFTMRRVFSIYLPIMEFSYADVLRVPQCEACGSNQGRDEPTTYFDVRQLVSERAL